MNSAMEISKYILNKTPMSNLRLQKILYFIQCESYRKYKKPAFNEKITSLKHGPVVPIVYYEFCAYGGTTIHLNKEINLEEQTKAITDDIVNRYKDVYIWDLVAEACRYRNFIKNRE